MTRYRHALPQLSEGLFLTDGGAETTFIFHDGIELPYFAAFDLLRTTEGTEHLRRYYRSYLDLARRDGAGFVLEAPTWRASRDWAEKLGYTPEALAAVNRDAIALMESLRAEYDGAVSPIVISACIGPRGDGYRAEKQMSAAEAEEYHAEQIAVFAATGADMASAFTLPYAEEAVGVARAARRADMPCVISFTLETDGRLPSGQSLAEAIRQVDAETGAAPAYYMINCAHPAHFDFIFVDDLVAGSDWISRIRGIRANASMRSHAELDEAPDLDAGDPADLGRRYAHLRRRLPHLAVLGGCCGTDLRHVDRISACCALASRAA